LFRANTGHATKRQADANNSTSDTRSSHRILRVNKLPFPNTGGAAVSRRTLTVFLHGARFRRKDSESPREYRDYISIAPGGCQETGVTHSLDMVIPALIASRTGRVFRACLPKARSYGGMPKGLTWKRVSLPCLERKTDIKALFRASFRGRFLRGRPFLRVEGRFCFARKGRERGEASHAR
jgi:hypothetical protein